MATVTRANGASLAWRSRGDGPLVVITTQVFAHPAVQSALAAELVRDHQVLDYDPRGCGDSSGAGPYDIRTDAADLLAIIDAASGPPDRRAVIVGLLNAAEVAVLAAAEAPELVAAVVVPLGNPAGMRAARGSEALLSSASVLAAIDEMLAKDYRTALRTIIASGNPQMSEQEVRERIDRQVEYCPAEVAIARMESWRHDGVLDQARALGGRLWLLQHPHNPWFPSDMLGRTRELLPGARIEEIEDGHLTRPDLTAGVISRITGEIS
jgi:pimeloyl-ACP methyl ester carboxylesterase